MPFGPRRAGFINAADRVFEEGWPLDEATVEQCEAFDLIYRTLCAVMYNYVPLSGHPGGSISSGRFVARLLFETMDYDLADPDRQDADIISYAAGHKALGLYAMWALRNEVARIAAPDLLPRDEKFQLRLEDLLGFRRNPTTTAPLFKNFTRNHSMDTRHPPRRSLGCPLARLVSVFQHRSAWPGPRATFTETMRRACTSSRVKAE
jgi:transketolase